jgi:hypothetical protein
MAIEKESAAKKTSKTAKRGAASGDRLARGGPHPIFSGYKESPTLIVPPLPETIDMDLEMDTTVERVPTPPGFKVPKNSTVSTGPDGASPPSPPSAISSPKDKFEITDNIPGSINGICEDTDGAYDAIEQEDHAWTSSSPTSPPPCPHNFGGKCLVRFTLFVSLHSLFPIIVGFSCLLWFAVVGFDRFTSRIA